jgi:hypothetical protein
MEKQEKILQEIAEKHFEEFVESQKKVKSWDYNYQESHQKRRGMMNQCQYANQTAVKIQKAIIMIELFEFKLLSINIWVQFNVKLRSAFC